MRNKLLKSYDNNAELFWNIIGSVGVKGLAMLVNILSLPAYLYYFSDQKILGVWFTIISVLNWILTFDLGIGNGLRNLIIEPYLNKQYNELKEYISTAYISIGIICLILSLFSFVLAKSINWNNFLNISDKIINPGVLFDSIFIVFLTVVCQLFLRLIVSILYALQKTAISNAISLISNTIILLFLISFKFESAPKSLISLSYVYFIAINIPLLIATVVVFFTKLRKAKPNLRFFRYKLTSKILNLGLMFLGIQVSLVVINSTNELIIAKYFQLENVVEYQTYFRIFNIFLVLFSLITIPIWSAVTKAFVNKNIKWIKKIYFYLNIVAVVFTIFIFLSCFFINDIVHIWIGPGKIKVSYLTTFLIATYTSLMIFIYASNCIANGISKLKPQLIINLIAAIIKFPLFVLFYHYYNNWNLIILINIFIILPAIIIQPIQNYKELKKNKIKKMKTLC
ncbi:MATE family efflux transporter [Arenibacter amylolyticus]|uniref:hypothetical protein n=1 Tax=Arenibacter amylolyticus TaxID=1406873 RepID=UPI000A36B996|nr:hypothetical protein [Arenibacter amylolyticus]